ncbi:MAG: TrkH family potassium uptake protein [Clostridiales bacterium]|nr:TrkH family potassium uptake protein [Clostridiales bacterium]
MNKALVFRTLGKLMLMEAALMLPSFGVSLLYADGMAFAFLLTFAIVAALSLPLVLLLKPAESHMYIRDGMAVAGLGWVLISFFGSLPLVFGKVCGLADAFFEIASGFTTTGATVLTNVDNLSPSIAFLRSATHWIGGMGVLVLTTAVLPGMNGQSSSLAKAESSGPSYSKLLPKVGDNSKLLYIIYSVLTIMLFLLLKLCGMNWFDSFLHAMSTAGTGGFSNRGLSIGYYNNLAVDIVTSIFMLLFGISFTVYFRLMAREFRHAFKNEELIVYFGICAVAVCVIAFDIRRLYSNDLGESFRYSFFQVSSIVSTTGFSTADFDLWPNMSKAILFILMIIGSCAGSTAGGLKLIRAILLTKLASREIVKAFSPRKVKVIKLDGKSVPEDMLNHISVFFYVYMLITAVGVLTLAISGCDLTEAISGSIACISNIGPAFGRLGASGSFAFLPSATKVIMALIMLAGRLEFYPLLILACPSAWRKT